MWSEEYYKWRSVITEHYNGSLKNFKDKATIEILLDRARAKELELNTFLDAMEGFPNIDVEPFRDEIIKIINIRQELENWP